MAIIQTNLFGGMAGRLGKVAGVVIHNDAGSMSAKQYVNWLKGHNPEAGFAHYYIDRNDNARVENTYNRAWHCGDSWNPNGGNANYLGYEVCQSLSATDAEFLANEQAVFKQCAIDLKYYGLQPNRQTVRLHREFSSTTCPHRSWELHGRSVTAVQDYFISQIKRYMNGSTPAPTPAPSKPAPSKAKFKVGDTVKVTKAVDTSGKKLRTDSGNYSVMKVQPNRIVIGRNGVVTAAMPEANITLSKGSVTKPPAPKPKPTIKVGSRVAVAKSVDVNGTKLYTSGIYNVMELKGSRAVIGRGGVVTAAIPVGNLRLA